MKKKTNINGLWRFYDVANGIGGICVGANIEEAKYNAQAYLEQYFNDIYDQNFKVMVWEIEKDDDYHDAVAFATNY